MTETLIGVVLAGGESRRMGRDKTKIVLDGRTLVEQAVARLEGIVDEVLVADREAFPDGPGRGPAAGVLGAAIIRPDAALLATACDLPRVTPELLRALTALDGDWVVPRHEGGIEPLCALYRPPALDALREQVESGRYALHRLESANLDVRYLENEDLAKFDADSTIFTNLNSPEDLAALRRLAKPAHGR